MTFCYNLFFLMLSGVLLKPLLQLCSDPERLQLAKPFSWFVNNDPFVDLMFIIIMSLFLVLVIHLLSFTYFYSAYFFLIFYQLIIVYLTSLFLEVILEQLKIFCKKHNPISLVIFLLQII